MCKEFKECRQNTECEGIKGFSTLQQVKGRLQLDTLIQKYGMDGVKRIAKYLDKNE